MLDQVLLNTGTYIINSLSYLKSTANPLKCAYKLDKHIAINSFTMTGCSLHHKHAGLLYNTQTAVGLWLRDMDDTQSCTFST